MHVRPDEVPAFRAYVEETYGPELLMADGFDAAILGIVEVKGREPVVLYDRERCLEILEEDMDPEAAEEYLDFNVTDAFLGPYTPAFVSLWREQRERIL
jgi:hypothetical protein